MQEFSKDVQIELGCYVYRLVDPRNGQTFYVGRGRNNRVFDHVKGFLKDNGEGAMSLKNQKIRQIKESGLDVISIIQVYGLDDAQAKIVESVLISVYSLDSLTNIVNGKAVLGPANVEQLQNELSRSEYQDRKDLPKYIIIKTRPINTTRYESTRKAWKIDIGKAKEYKYALSCTDGIVKEVYKIENWVPSDEIEGRYEFVGTVADDEVAKYFKDHKIPSYYSKKGQSNPIQYSIGDKV